jgi:hypothetical protein
MGLLKALWKLVRSWFSSQGRYKKVDSLLEQTSDQTSEFIENSDVHEQKKSKVLLLPLYEENFLIPSFIDIDQEISVEDVEADSNELHGDFITTDEFFGVPNNPLQKEKHATTKKPPRLSPTPNYTLERVKTIEHDESPKVEILINRRPELIFDSKQLKVLLKIWVREDLLNDNLQAPEGFFVRIDSSSIAVEINQAQAVFGEGNGFFECSAVVEKAFKTIAINASENLGQSCFSLSSIKRELYIFKDTNSCECPYISSFDKELRPRALSSGYYWFIYRNDVTISGPREDFYDNRPIWDNYSVIRVEISDDTETIITNNEGDIILRLPPNEGYKIEGESLLDDDPKRPILKGQPYIKAPVAAKGKVVVWLRSQTEANKNSWDWYLEKDRKFSLGEHFTIPFGFNQIDIIESDGTICTRHFRWLPFLDSIKYPRGIILPIDGHHDDVSVIIKKNDVNIEIFGKNSTIRNLSEQTVHLSVPANIDKEVITLSHDSTKICELICELKRFRWVIEYKGIKLRENDPALIVERSQLDYTFPTKLSFPEWITSIAGEQWLVLKDSQGIIMREPLRLKERFPYLELGVFLDTIISNPGSLYLIWTYSDKESRYEQALFSIPPEFRICCLCKKIISGDDFHSHILKCHVESCFEKLDYQSIRQRYMPELPEKIYICTLCGHYVKSSPYGISAVTQMKHHFSQEHFSQNESFAECTDVDEIRRKYEKSLPLIYVCKSCGKEIVLTPKNKYKLLREHAGIHPEIVNGLFDAEQI